MTTRTLTRPPQEPQLQPGSPAHGPARDTRQWAGLALALAASFGLGWIVSDIRSDAQPAPATTPSTLAPSAQLAVAPAPAPATTQYVRPDPDSFDPAGAEPNPFGAYIIAHSPPGLDSIAQFCDRWLDAEAKYGGFDPAAIVLPSALVGELIAADLPSLDFSMEDIPALALELCDAG